MISKNHKTPYGTLSLKKKNKKHFILLNILIFLIGLLIIGIVYFIAYSSMPRVTKLEINGINLIKKEMLMATITSKMISESHWRSLVGWKNILFWQFGDLPDISKIIPRIQKIVVNKNLFQRTISIDVKEREPLGVWCLSSGNCYGFDDSGVAFTNSPNIDGYLILKVVDANNQPIKLGEPVLKNSEWLSNLLSVISNIKASGFYPRVVSINDTVTEEWGIETSSGQTLLFSFRSAPENLGNILAELSSKINFNDVGLIDFRIPQKIYYKIR